eukprot:764236-Hanusia_phi.AAC.2
MKDCWRRLSERLAESCHPSWQQEQSHLGELPLVIVPQVIRRIPRAEESPPSMFHWFWGLQRKPRLQSRVIRPFVSILRSFPITNTSLTPPLITFPSTYSSRPASLPHHVAQEVCHGRKGGLDALEPQVPHADQELALTTGWQWQGVH